MPYGDVVKTIDEFREELRILREDMYQNMGTADLKLIASYLDRLILSLESVSETLELTDSAVEALSSSGATCPCCEEKPKKKAKAAKRPKKKAKRK